MRCVDVDVVLQIDEVVLELFENADAPVGIMRCILQICRRVGCFKEVTDEGEEGRFVGGGHGSEMKESL